MTALLVSRNEQKAIAEATILEPCNIFYVSAAHLMIGNVW